MKYYMYLNIGYQSIFENTDIRSTDFVEMGKLC